MNKSARNAILWVLILSGLFALFQMLPGVSNRKIAAYIPYSQFVKDIEGEKVEKVTLSGPHIVGQFKNGQAFISVAPDHSTSLVDKLLQHQVTVEAVPLEHEVPFWQLILSWLPLLFFAGLIFYSFRQIQSGGNRALGFGRSRAKLVPEKNQKITFEDVAGIDEAKEELGEIVEFLKEPKKFQRLGGRIPRGVLLVGPPGTGKTLLARAIAGEAAVPFFSISGSDFVEMFVGVGASRVRDMFEQASKSSPCIIFIDEIDAVGRHRGVGLGGGNDEREQTLNQLLVEMDGFDENQGIIIVAATNRPDILDPALLRPGRFDRQITVSNPDVLGREQILRVHMKKVPLSSNVDPKILARGTPGFSGADLANLVNEAALVAARKGKMVVSLQEFEYAKDKVMMGAERKSLVMRDEERRLTAYHEAGHAIVAFYLIDSDPIHKATIIPRGRALGMVMRLPENDRISVSKKKLFSDLKVAMGGRIAEEMIFGPECVTTGASSDIKAATDIARKMVIEWGMSDILGFRSYSPPQEDIVFGHMASSKPYSELTAQTVDAEIQKILSVCFNETKALLRNKIDDLHSLSKALLEKETLTGDEIKSLLETGALPEAPIQKQTRTTIPLEV